MEKLQKKNREIQIIPQKFHEFLEFLRIDFAEIQYDL